MFAPTAILIKIWRVKETKTNMVRVNDVVAYVNRSWEELDSLRNNPAAFALAVTKLSMSRSELLIVQTMRFHYLKDKEEYVAWLKKSSMLGFLIFIDFFRAREELMWPDHTPIKVSGGRITLVNNRNRSKVTKAKPKPMPESLQNEIIAELMDM